MLIFLTSKRVFETKLDVGVHMGDHYSKFSWQRKTREKTGKFTGQRFSTCSNDFHK